MPEIWFIQAEHIFALNRITSEMSKYRHLVAVLPQEALEELLSSSEIGDRSPSAFFRDMENITGSSNIVNTNLLKRIWLRKLPEQVKIRVTSSNFEDMPLILTLADKVWEVTHTSPIASVPSQPLQTGSTN